MFTCLKDKKLILASQSPRRAQLLKGLGLDFEVRTYDTDESFPDDLPSDQVAEYVATAKMAEAERDFSSDEMIITADSVVVLDGKILGKPKDIEEAKSTLRMLSGKTHMVYTGVCISDIEQSISFTEETLVKFFEISEEEIIHYVSNYEVMDKAGSYGIQDWIGLAKVAEIRGSYTNIMGLPTHRIYDFLKDWDALWLAEDESDWDGDES